MHLKPLLRTGICHISAYISLTLASHMAKLTFGQGSYLTTGRYCKAHVIRWSYIYILLTWKEAQMTGNKNSGHHTSEENNDT